LYRNFGKYKSTLRNISEERRSHLRRGGNLRSRNFFNAKTCINFSSKNTYNTWPYVRIKITPHYAFELQHINVLVAEFSFENIRAVSEAAN
jgi:hypothetical protein